MNASTLQGIFFGLTKGTVTTMGIIIGLFASAPIKKAIIGAVVAATVSDTFGDSIGIFYSEKARNVENVNSNPLNVVYSLIVFKLLISLLYLLPIIFFTNLKYGVIGSLLLSGFVIVNSLTHLAKKRKENVRNFVIKNSFIIFTVILITYTIGTIINRLF